MSSQDEATINHFSHPHPMHLSNHQNSLIPVSCSGCKTKATGFIYSCSACNYFLHSKCAKMPQQITHPFDKDHVLSLFPKPLYQEGFFNCDACGKQGEGFCYHCKICKIDLHILCSAMPLNLTHQSHCHQLKLVFSPPHVNVIFNCDICNTTGSNHWRYRCHLCDFDVHLNCTNGPAPVRQTSMNHSQTKYVAAPNQTPIPQFHHILQQPGMASVSTSHVLPQAPNYHAFNPQFPAAAGVHVPNFMPTMNPLNHGIHPPVNPFLQRQQNDQMLFLQNLQALLGNSPQNSHNQQYLQALLAGGGLGGGGGGLGGGAGGLGGAGGGLGRMQQFLQPYPGTGNYGGGGIPGLNLSGNGGGRQNTLQTLLAGGAGGLHILQGLMGVCGNGQNVLGGDGVLSMLNGLDLGGLFGG